MGTSITAVTVRTRQLSLDALGASASLVCAVHCAVVALFLGAMPLASVLSAGWVDWLFLGLSVGIGAAALIPGYRRHGRRAPLRLFAAGVLLLAILRTLRVEASLVEVAVVVLAAALLVTAHWINRGALHRCAAGSCNH